MLHHLSFSVENIERSARFYDALLGPLGYRRVCEGKVFVGYGTKDNKDKFAIKQRVESVSKPSPGFHVAFRAAENRAVEEAHTAGTKFGGADNGKPGFRDHYGPSYFAAFLIDPDGYEVEVVCNGK